MRYTNEFEIFQIGLLTRKLAPMGLPTHWVVGMPGHTLGCPVGQNGQKTLKYVCDIQIELEISQIGLLTRKLAPMGTPTHWVVGMPGHDLGMPIWPYWSKIS